MDETNRRPNFSRAYSKANEVLVRSKTITTFPYSADKLVQELSDIRCRSYTQARKYNVDISSFGSESAILMELRGKRIIFYNDDKPQTHINFSLLHELGHYLNGHDTSNQSIDEETYHRYEVETNCFAAQLLMPEQIIRELQRRGQRITPNFLKRYFRVSGQAANKRIETLSRTHDKRRSKEEKEFDDIILAKYANFADAICPTTNRIDLEYDCDMQGERDRWFQETEGRW